MTLRPPGRITRQLASFAAIGVVSTLAYVALYSLLRNALPAEASNALALLATALGNTAANRRLTFDVRGSDRLAQDHLAGLGALVIALGITSASIELLRVVAPSADRTVELTVLVSANVVATVVRFLVLRLSLDRNRVPAGLGRAATQRSAR